MRATHHPTRSKPAHRSAESSAPRPERSSSSRSSRRALLWRALAVAGVVVALIVLSRLLPLRSWVAALDGVVQRLGFWGPIAWGAIYVVGCLLLVPGLLFTIGAGALFGLLGGMLVAASAAIVAATLAFVLARHLARPIVEKLARRYRTFGAFDQAIAQGGWKVVALLRLSPVVPFSVSNYLFGLMKVGLGPYAGATSFAILPGTFLYVYLGHAGRQSVSALSGGRAHSPLEWVLLGVGLLATAAAAIYVSRLARKRLHARHARRAAG